MKRILAIALRPPVHKTVGCGPLGRAAGISQQPYRPDVKQPDDEGVGVLQATSAMPLLRRHLLALDDDLDLYRKLAR